MIDELVMSGSLHKRYPEIVSVILGERDGYYTAKCEDLPGFFIYDEDFGVLFSEIKPCLILFYEALFQIKVNLTDVSDRTDDSELRFQVVLN